MTAALHKKSGVTSTVVRDCLTARFLAEHLMIVLNTDDWPQVEGPGRREHHEAGHAFVAMALGFRVRAITTIPSQGADATTYIELPIYPGYLDHVRMALVACAGLAAEARFCQLSGLVNVGFMGHRGDKRKAYASMDAIGHGPLFVLYVEWVGEFLKDPRVWSALSNLVAVIPACGFLDDPGVISAVAREVPRFEGAIFDNTLAIVEEAKIAGLMHRLHDSSDG